MHYQVGKIAVINQRLGSKFRNSDVVVCTGAGLSYFGIGSILNPHLSEMECGQTPDLYISCTN